MSNYTIKLEDKAAFLNALKSVGIGVNSLNITDNEVKNNFEVTFKNPQDEKIAKDILKTHSGIDQLEEVLRKIIREEISHRKAGR